MDSPLFDRDKLTKLRDEFAVRAAGKVHTTSLESIEWQRMHVQTRILLLVAAGIDGELEPMALKDWQEYPPPERLALRGAIRHLRREMFELVGLARYV